MDCLRLYLHIYYIYYLDVSGETAEAPAAAARWRGLAALPGHREAGSDGGRHQQPSQAGAVGQEVTRHLRVLWKPQLLSSVYLLFIYKLLE